VVLIRNGVRVPEMAPHFFSSDARTATAGIDASLLDGRRILVTGASGAVGIHVVAALRAFAEDGRDIDLTATVHSDVPPPLAAVFEHPFCHVVRGDLCDHSVRGLLPLADLIVHCTGYGQPGRFLESPLKTIRLNSEVTCDLIERLRPSGRLLFVSSTEVYSGLPSGNRYREDQIGLTGPHHPRACYIEGKRCGETLCYSAFQSGLGALSVRLAQTYGPGAKRGDRRALYSFIEQALFRKHITLLDDGAAVRTYCYAADAARMMLTVLLKGTQPVYNVGGATSIRIGDVATQVGDLLHVPVTFPDESQPSPGAADSVMIDMSRYESEFGGESYIGLDVGLQRTVDWHKQFV
jgi:nucleoside-diphosphate-sugar epimerase